MNPATKVETSWCNVFPVQLMSQSGIHVTVDPIDRGHVRGQIGLSEFRPDPLAEVKKVKTPLPIPSSPSSVTLHAKPFLESIIYRALPTPYDRQGFDFEH